MIYDHAELKKKQLLDEMISLEGDTLNTNYGELPDHSDCYRRNTNGQQ